MPGVMKGASVSKGIQSGVESVICGYLVDDGVGDSVELSREGKEGGRMAVIPMLVFEFLILASSRLITSITLPSFEE